MASLSLLRHVLRQFATKQPSRITIGRHELEVQELEPRQLFTTGSGLILSTGRVDLPSARFVTALYQDLLSRVPQQAEVATWAAALDSGLSREQIARAFSASAEYRSNSVFADYRMLLGREPAGQEVAAWLRRMEAGLSEAQVTVGFLASEEYYRKHGNSAEPWLKGVYQDVLGRRPDAAGLDAWRRSLQDGVSLAAVATGFVDSREARERQVIDVYHTLLRRDPDTVHLASWGTALGEGLTASELLAKIAGSPAYVTQHQQSITTTPSPHSINGPHAIRHIDASWFGQQGPGLQDDGGPFWLDQPDTEYVLDTDVRVEKTAFIVAAANITLDLNGHEVIYGDSAPLEVANADFTQGSDPTDVPGWDVSQAPTAERLPARTGMISSMMLEVSGITDTQSIVSSPIAIPEAGREYAALITPKGSANGALQLSVIDAVTGGVLGSEYIDGLDSGSAPVVKFTPESTNPVQLLVEMFSDDGEPVYVDLDSAAVMTAGDYGIFTYSSQGAANFTVKNGQVTQGQARGYASYPLNFNAIPGFTVDEVTTFSNGVDTNNLDASYAYDGIVQNSVFTSKGGRISERQVDYAALKLGHFGGTLSVVDNWISGFPQAGIFVNSDGELESTYIAGNDIRQQAVVTNGYGIYLYNAGPNFEIADNRIVPVKGRGLLIEGYAADGDVHGNYVDVSEDANLEYDAEGLYAIALRMRNWQTTQANIDIHDNTFIARTGPGEVHAAMAVVLTSYNDQGQMDGANNVLENNVIKAIVETDDTFYSAAALAISGIDAGTGWQFNGNVLESNDTSLVFGTDDSWEHADDDLSFTSNTVRRSGEGAARDYTGIRAGAWENEVVGVSLIDTRFENGASSDVVFEGSRPKDVRIGYFLTLTVRDGSGAPVANADVRLYDNTEAEVFAGTTDDNGQAVVPVITTVLQQTGEDPTDMIVDERTPHLVTATSATDSASAEISLSESMSLTLYLGADSMRSTSTSVVSSIGQSVFGQAVTFTATVSSIPPAQDTPTGQLIFRDDSTTLGTRTLNGLGQATLLVSNLAVGVHRITAVYGGDPSFRGSTSAVLNESVNRASTASTLVSSARPSVFGQPVTLTATVSAVAPGGGIPTGPVIFKEGDTILGTGTLDGRGQATLNLSTLSVATHNLTAVYGGDTNFTAGTSAVLAQKVDKAGSTTAVVSSLNPSTVGQSVTFTATVSAIAPGGGTPQGSVVFKDGASSLGTVALDVSGQATFTTSNLRRGSHNITAVYGGNGNYTASTSAALTQVVHGDTPPPPPGNSPRGELMSSINALVAGQPVMVSATSLGDGDLGVARGRAMVTGSASRPAIRTTAGTASVGSSVLRQEVTAVDRLFASINEEERGIAWERPI